ncbi:MAG: G-D-S-L family lipolytic protein [Bacteroidetes bacterium]|nr:G-D-S-L family lipolytic protein [Bacteroidota bacterium]
MIKFFYKLILIYLLVITCSSVIAQPFIDDIRAFKKQDSISAPPRQAILFVGSSSFTKWRDVADYFPSYTIINRGFGGSTLLDVIRYADDVIFRYDTKQIVIYCGENDLASSDTVTAKMVFQRFRKLYSMIRAKLPSEKIAFISLKPSPSRARLKSKMLEANSLIKKYISKQKNISFIDVYPKMLNADGKPKPEIYVEDSLHMNAKGYAIWQKIIQPYLVK